MRGGIVDLYPGRRRRAAAARFVRRHARSRPQLRSADPALDRQAATSSCCGRSARCCSTTTAIHRFRSRYREQFGATGTTTRSTNRSAPAGAMSAWSIGCRCITSELETLFDYLPGRPVVARPPGRGGRAATGSTRSPISTRRASNVTAGARAGAPVYRPVPPEQLYLDADEWRAALRGRAPSCSCRRSPPPRAPADAVRCRRPPARNFAAERADPNVNLFEAVRDYLEAERKSGRRTAIAAFSEGSAERLAGRAARARRRRPAPGRRRRRRSRRCRARRSGSRSCRSSRASRPTASRPARRAGHPRRPAGAAAAAAAHLDQFIAEAAALAPGDLVVHAEHGIGRYEGLETLEVGGAPHDCLRLPL